MARPLRIEFPNAWYHVMNRDRRHDRIYLDSKDDQAFIDLLKSVSVMFNAAAYALMLNHFHLESIKTQKKCMLRFILFYQEIRSWN